MSYSRSEDGINITRDYPDGDYAFQVGIDSPENRAMAEQRLKANGCRTIRFETQEIITSDTDSELSTVNMLYAHGYLTERTFVALQ